MTANSLNALTRRELAQKARRKGISGWHGMRKKELVEALLDIGKHRRQRERSAAPTVQRERNGERRGPVRLTTTAVGIDGPVQDTLTATVIDGQWVELVWSLSGRMIGRAEASLGADWHSAVPVIRVEDVSQSDQTGHVKDVEITGQAEKWFLPLDDPTLVYRLHVGYRTRNGQFFSLARSRRVSLPQPGSSSRLRRPGVVSRRSGRVPVPASLREQTRKFEVEAELVVHGHADPHAVVTLLGESVVLDEDGYFSVRTSLPEGRQVIPAVAVTPGGEEQRTIVLAIERNTKTLEPESLVES